MKVLIVGGVAGGASAAARLRRLNEKAEIILFEKGNYISFANCGLPYYIGDVIQSKSALTLQTPLSFYNRFRVDVRTETEVLEVLPSEKAIRVKNLKTGEEYTETYDKLILSPGASPIRPSMEGIYSSRVFTLRNIPNTLEIKAFMETENPRSVAVVGGGYIGVEMAENLKNAGIEEVSIIELQDHIIAPLDSDMAADVQNYLESKGITLYLQKAVTGIKETQNGLLVSLGEKELAVDFLLMSVGVKPDTAFLASTNIERNAKGAIVVDENMKTSVKDIYAVGDAVEVQHFITKEKTVIPLAGPANKEGRIVADVVSGYDSAYMGTMGSSILKIFEMSVASTGFNEKMLKERNIDYDKVYAYSASHATYYPGATNMSIKVLFDKNSLEILGAQIVGMEGVDKRMDVLATAMHYKGKITDLKDLELTYAPPFGSAKDPVNMVGFIAENVVTGKMKQFFPEDVKDLPKDGSVTLLDVRTDLERQGGFIEGFIHIPLDELREHLDLIPREKPVYVHCHSGLRSYIACRILEGNSYDSFNLAGGYRLYHSMDLQHYV